MRIYKYCVVYSLGVYLIQYILFYEYNYRNKALLFG